MSDPKRYRDTEQHLALHAALDAAAGDHAPPGTQAKMLAALGMGAGAGGAGSGTLSGAGAASGAAALLGSTAAKVALGVVVLATLTATWVAVSIAPRGREDVSAKAAAAPDAEPVAAVREVPPPVVSATTEAPVTPRRAATSAEESARGEPTPAAPATPATLRAAPRPADALAPTEAPTASALTPPRAATEEAVDGGALPTARPSTLTEELALLADANAALRRRDAAGATRALDEYQARFPRGSLSVEAEALRVETVSATDPERARLLARAFVERHPSSPVAARMRRIADGAPVP